MACGGLPSWDFCDLWKAVLLEFVFCGLWKNALLGLLWPMGGYPKKIFVVSSGEAALFAFFGMLP